MIHRGNGPLASRLRQRKFQLLRRFSIPADALPGSLSLSHLHCGKPTCHCANDRGHAVWSLTFMVQGKKQVQHIPKDWVEEVRRRVKAGREFQDAVREVLAANAQLLVLERKKPKKRKNEPFDARSSAPLRDTASSPPTVSQGSWRRSATTPDSSAGTAVGLVDRPNPPAIEFSCRRGAGTIFSTTHSQNRNSVL